MAVQLIRLRRLTISTDIKALKKLIGALCGYRDKLAHGIWIFHSDQSAPVLVETRGEYPPAPGQKTISARIAPRSVAITIKNLRDVTRGIERAQRILETMHHEIIAQLAPSPQKPGARLPAVKKASRGRQTRQRRKRPHQSPRA